MFEGKGTKGGKKLEIGSGRRKKEEGEVWELKMETEINCHEAKHTTSYV